MVKSDSAWVILTSDTFLIIQPHEVLDCLHLKRSIQNAASRSSTINHSQWVHVSRNLKPIKQEQVNEYSFVEGVM